MCLCLVLGACGHTPIGEQLGDNEQRLYLLIIAGLREQGLHQAALAHLDEYERRYGRNRQTALLRGQSLLDSGREEEAVDVLRTITDGPEAGAAASALGHLYARRGRWSDAEQFFRDATRREPSNARYLNNLGYALLHVGKVAEAEQYFRAAWELERTNPAIRNNLVIFFLVVGRSQEANSLLRQVANAHTRTELRRQAMAIRSRLMQQGGGHDQRS